MARDFETIETRHDNWIESAFLIDLRRHARFDTNFPGEAFAESGEHVHVTITNISLSGLQLEGSRQTVGALFANLDRRTPDTDSHTPLEVHFSVPTDSDHLVPVKVHCKTAYTRRAGKDTYQIGMEFVTFEEGGRAVRRLLNWRAPCRRGRSTLHGRIASKDTKDGIYRRLLKMALKTLCGRRAE